jgi:tRNA nucleotidyltransferase (CCA-adding enzyme)
MNKNLNLKEKIHKQFPQELVEFLQTAGSTAENLGCRVFLVGGAVRDLLLARINLDLDLVVEGDAIILAEKLAKINNGKVIAHSRFNTAKIKWEKWTVDIASARAEGYEKPGALPTVQSSDLKSDLIRRDFTINAMAVSLDPQNYGELIDLYQGQQDLDKGLIRILHDNSFKDDATRIWRAVRYEQRLDFKIEPHTLDLIKEQIAFLDAISGDRIRHELELCLEEDKPEKALSRANNLGLLNRIHPSLEADEWLVNKFIKARGIIQPYTPPEELYLSFLIYRLTMSELNQVISYLKFTRNINQTLADCLNLKSELKMLSETDIPPSWIYRYLSPYTLTSILANMIACNIHLVKQRMELFLNKLHHVQPLLSGEELIEAGIPAGPHVKEILVLLREARLDGKVSTAAEELAIVKKMGKAIK